MATQVLDPFESAADPQVRTGTSDYYGQVKIETWFCTLVKGTGKVPFDPQQHSEDQRRTAIEVNVYPLAEMNIRYDVARNMIAESREWAGIVLPSIKALGVTPRELNNAWAHLQTVETGETWVKNGETRKKTTFKFVELFKDEAACRAAYQAAGNGSPVAAPAPEVAPANGNGNGSKEKETAAKFLRPIVENAARGQSDLDVIRNTITMNLSNMPAVGKFFTVDSPEVAEMLFQVMSK